MDINEVKQKIENSENKDWYNQLEININYPSVGISKNLKGYTNIYQYYHSEKEKWNHEEDEGLGGLKTTKQYFNNAFTRIERILTEPTSTYSTKESRWRELTNSINNRNENIFPYDTPEAKFILKILKEFPFANNAAINFLSGNFSEPRRIDDIIGYNLAYEFRLKDKTEIAERINNESKSIQTLRNEFDEYIKASEKRFDDQMAWVNEISKEYAQNIDHLKDEKSNEFDAWFQGVHNSHQEYVVEQERDMLAFKTTYAEHLKLSEPAQYWNKRAKQLKKEGRFFTSIFVSLSILGVSMLFSLLIWTPEGMLLSIADGNAKAVKWSIVFVVLISFLAFGIRILAKIAFSSFHLARDAEEREQLTYFYLALIKDSSVGQEERQLIMQSLFSRSETGLLKEEHGPTLPGSSNIVNNLMGK